METGKCNNSSNFYELIRQNDYTAVRHFPPTMIGNSLDWYLYYRAAITTGDYTQVEITPALLSKNEETESGFVSAFLKLQIAMFRNRNLQETIGNLMLLPEPSHPFLRAEYFFIIGFAFLDINNYQKASSYFLKASRLYAEINFPFHKANTLFNLAICHLNLNEKTSIRKYEDELTKIESNHPGHPLPLHLILRLKIYKALNADDHPAAITLLEELLPIYKATERHRDLGDAYCSLAYCCLIASDLERFDRLIETIYHGEKRLDRVHTLVLHFFEELRFANQINRSLASRLIKSWVAARIQSIYLMNLIHVLLERLKSQEAHDVMFYVVGRADSIKDQLNQVGSTLDLLYYRILTEVHFFQPDKAKSNFGLYLSMLPTNRSEKQNAKVAEIRSLLKSEPEQFRTLRFNIAESKVSINTKDLEFSKQELLFNAIVLLAKNRDGINLGEFFEGLYKIEYNPLYHESRLASLINRLRICFGKDIIVRSGTKLSLSKNIYIEPFTNSRFQPEMLYRRKAILKAISQAESPISISEIVRILKFCRRTTQHDLKTLNEDGLVGCEGRRRGRRYFIAKEASYGT